MTIVSAWCEHGQTPFVRAPLEDIDINVTHSPTAHLESAGFVKIDGVGADESAPVIIDLKNLLGADDPESGAEGKAGPIRGGAVRVASGKPRTDRVLAAARFTMSVGGGADVGDSPAADSGSPDAGLGCAASYKTSRQ